MKRYTVICAVLCLLLSFGMAFANEEKAEPPKDEGPKSICPTSLMKESCFTCHVVSNGKFVLKETKIDAHLDYPNGTKIINFGTPDAYGYFEMGQVDYSTSEQAKNFFNYLRRHKIDRAVMEIVSGGGDLLLGWRIKAFMDEWKAEGKTVETRVRCLAASAAFIVFLAGSDGHRVANATSELMMHELKLTEGGMFWFKETTPSSAEEQAKTLRHLQTTVNDWVARRSNLTKEKVQQMLQWKEFWVNGRQAKEYGLADIVIGD